MTPVQRVERVMDAVTAEASTVALDRWTWGALERIQKTAPEALTAQQERFLARIERQVLGEAAAA